MSKAKVKDADKFRNQLRIEFDNPQNGKGFEIDIKHRFLVGIGNYKDWYSSRKNEIEELFGKSNLYCCASLNASL